MLQCCSAAVLTCVLLCRPTGCKPWTWLTAVEGGHWSRVQTPDRGGEGREQLAGNLHTTVASHAHLNGASVLLNIMCNSDFRIHCLQPGDLQQHEEWSQACAEESWELHPATSFLWPGGREPGVSCAAPGRWTAATIKLVIWRQLVRYWHCFLSSWAVNYGTSQNFSARRWPLLGTTPCWKCLIPVLCFHSLL